MNQRVFWIGFGAVAHALFAVTVYFLYGFLRGAPPANGDISAPRWSDIGFDSLLALQFAVGHSALLHPAVRRRLARFVPGPAYGVFFCLCTSGQLLATIFAWRSLPGGAWCLSGPSAIAVEGAFYGSWLALFYSLYLAGIGYQTGWTTWWPWVRGAAVPRREFRPRSAFLWLRHPVYLSFLGLVWFTPWISWDRVVLIFWWTIYIFVGSALKDRRMEHYIGQPYRDYAARVPGYVRLPLLAVPWRRAVIEAP